MEDAYIVHGGKKLEGEVALSGAKNASLKMLIAALIFDEEVTFCNVPKINDVLDLMQLIRLMGGKADFTDTNTVVVSGKNITVNKLDLLHASKFRASFMFFAPLLVRLKECHVPNPGGCRIGARPIDRIIEGMKALGVVVDYDSKTGYYHAKMSDFPKGSYTFEKSSHTGTELLIMLSVIGKHSVTIGNAGPEPEIDALISFFNKAGGNIKRSGNDIIVKGVESLHYKEPFKIVSDRNEAITYVSMAIATKGSVTVHGIEPVHIQSFIDYAKKAGVFVEIKSPTSIYFAYKNKLNAVSIETGPHPGFMTDWQQNWAIMMLQADGECIIHERVFENRFAYVEELRKLGAKIDFVKVPVTNPSEYFFFNFDPSKKYQQAIKIVGPQSLHNGVVHITDLRAGATLVIASLVAQGETIIHGASIAQRGYEDLIRKVRALGGDIREV
ncbi:MAG: UDP-N-acetylglucosamine 1-carboxyvinyltransferase [Candidatus Roizmanbacteria bacterium]